MDHSPFLDRVAATVVNYQTPDLLETAVRTFHAVYPAVPLLLVDNGSQDTSRATIEQLQVDLGASLSVEWLAENRYHGPAMHHALERLQTPYVFVLDSDTETKRPGFLEAMGAVLEADETLYGAGQVVRANARGFRDDQGTPVLASAFMLLKRDLYHRFRPFVHHGLPALHNFEDAHQAGYGLHAFPIETYVRHLGRGTAERYGYGLGLRSKLDYVLNRLGF
ncbi:MAG: glycosyltransferase [Bacteroidota bacterium]